MMLGMELSSGTSFLATGCVIMNIAIIGLLFQYFATQVIAQDDEIKSVNETVEIKSVNETVPKFGRVIIPKNLTFKCIKAQKNFDTNKILGLWRVKQLIEHGESGDVLTTYLKPRIKHESCANVLFATDGDQTIRMLWIEKSAGVGSKKRDDSKYVQFDLRMSNIQNPGFLLCVGWQTGTLVDDNYKQFYGTVLVMKSNKSLLVLTFCSSEEKHFTVIMARHFLTKKEKHEVYNQLQGVNLQLHQFSDYCSSAFHVSSLTLMLVVAASFPIWLS
ncbi:uncharacterized protein LOC128993240 [Macrosteles quadrilineatus]|uniref:uncharacterized protein LOC128993240 n=1 Tax=Macrosteles quadrilineatus TaxID=74068 RepID=UPI0023E2431D|nr:uncharacterized protein LOC128993240 [Macrosteles quadrilineatus]